MNTKCVTHTHKHKNQQNQPKWRKKVAFMLWKTTSKTKLIRNSHIYTQNFPLNSHFFAAASAAVGSVEPAPDWTFEMNVANNKWSSECGMSPVTYEVVLDLFFFLFCCWSGVLVVYFFFHSFSGSYSVLLVTFWTWFWRILHSVRSIKKEMTINIIKCIVLYTMPREHDCSFCFP